jgi:hypothetical protein
MSSRRPFLVLPRFPGASLIVLEPSTQWRQPDAARTPAQLAATVNTGLVVAVVASRLLEHGSPTELSAATGVYATLRRSWDRGAG